MEMGGYDAKKWGRAPTGLHGITFQNTLCFMVSYVGT